MVSVAIGLQVELRSGDGDSYVRGEGDVQQRVVPVHELFVFVDGSPAGGAMLFAAPERSASKDLVDQDSPDRTSSEEARQRRERVCAPYAAARYPARQVHEGFEGIQGAFRKGKKTSCEGSAGREKGNFHHGMSCEGRQRPLAWSITSRLLPRACSASSVDFLNTSTRSWRGSLSGSSISLFALSGSSRPHSLASCCSARLQALLVSSANSLKQRATSSASSTLNIRNDLSPSS